MADSINKNYSSSINIPDINGFIDKESICKHILNDLTIIKIVNHKTGVFLSNGIFSTIAKYCNISHIDTHSINDLLKMFKIQKKRRNTLYIHFFREPVDTIISGYYYHLKCKEKEIVNKTINQYHCSPLCYFQIKYLYKHLINGNLDKYENVFHVMYQASNKYMKCFEFDELQKYISSDFVENIINKNAKYQLNRKLSIKEFYSTLNSNDIDNKIGLFWEFVRYFNCEWANIYIPHLIGSQYFKPNGDNFIEYNLRDFMNIQGFERNVNELLNALSIGKSDERDNLFGLLNKVNKLNGGEIEHSNKHITKNDYNKPIVIDQLLSIDKSICVVIKNLTIYLDYQWKYSLYC